MKIFIFYVFVVLSFSEGVLAEEKGKMSDDEAMERFRQYWKVASDTKTTEEERLLAEFCFSYGSRFKLDMTDCEAKFKYSVNQCVVYSYNTFGAKYEFKNGLNDESDPEFIEKLRDNNKQYYACLGDNLKDDKLKEKYRQCKW